MSEITSTDYKGDLSRPGESVEESARRVAIDAVYEARDKGGTMHDAGALAAERVLAVVKEGMR